jgi:glutamate synthase domain-containing protein 1
MLIPKLGHRTSMNPTRRFYEYHASMWTVQPRSPSLTAAWSALLDRNGLRPARYLVTHDGLRIMASETGVLP